MVKTKIICTLGPSCSDVTTLRKMMLAGMDVARLNFSHGTHADHASRIRIVRELNRKYRRHVRILQDLEGYRIRIGKLKGKQIALKKRKTVILTNDPNKHPDAIPFDYVGSLKDIKAQNFIYIDDGNIALMAKASSRERISAEVIVPGIVKENKGVNVPGIKLKFKDLSHKDKIDLDFGMRNGVDFIAQSFVRNRSDVLKVREFIGGRLKRYRIIAKIENRDGIRNLDEIIDTADGIMIARGDLGVSLPIYEVPLLQKMIIKKCKRRKKFVITATQMLESMTENTRPTRAEVSDVANAILDGSDYLMLSGETAAGRYPVRTVKMMNDVIKFTELFAKEK